jgi:hypothetical protein
VRRSASGLEPGSVIVFDNDVVTVWPCQIPGGNFGERLAVGDRAEVYLRPATSPTRQFVPNYVNKLR